MKELNDKLAEAFAAYNQNLTDSLDNYIDSLEKKIKDLQNAPYDPEDHVSFDKLGITRLFVDEAHNYTSRGFATFKLSASIPKVRYLVLTKPLLPLASWFCSISAYSLRMLSK